MSGNTPAAKRKVDPRIRRTRDRLGDALVELVQEKPFDSITVQEVLDRAGVSRSTFYAHYRDKHDLFVSDMDEFLDGMATRLSRCGDRSNRVAPVRELFAHVAEMRSLHSALVASGRIHDFLGLGQGHFARAIDQRLSVLPRARGITDERRTVTAQALAGALLSLLSWWIEGGTPGSPEEMDDHFHRMVWSGVGAEDRSSLRLGAKSWLPGKDSNLD